MLDTSVKRMYREFVGNNHPDLTSRHPKKEGFAQPFDLLVTGVYPGGTGGRCEAFFMPSSDRDGIVQLRYSVETGDHEAGSLPQPGISQ